MLNSKSKFSKHWDKHSAEEIRAYQDIALSQFVANKLVPHSKHYNQLFASHNLRAEDIKSVEDLQKVPFTCKQDLLSTPEAPQKSRDFIIIPDKAKLSKQPGVIFDALTHGKKYVEKKLNREYRPIFMTSTTGRSTEPVPFVYSQHDLDILSIGGGRLIEIGGGLPDERILNMFPYAPHLAYWLAHYASMEKGIFSLGSGGGKVMGTDGNIRLIERIKPNIIVGMPTFVYHVFYQSLLEKKRFEGLRLVVLGGEKVAPGTRRRLAEMAEELGSPGIKVMSTYGFTEAKMAWTECPIDPGTESAGYHIYPDLGVIEIIDPQSGEVMPEGKGGEIVYTPFDARGSVTFRYRTGDYAEHGVTTEPCPCCGRIVQRIIGKISRSSEIRSMQLQKLKGTLVDFNSLEVVLDDIDMLGTWQLELRKKNDDPLGLDELILHVSLKDQVSQDTLKDEVHSHFAKAVEVTPNRIEIHSEEEMRRKQKVGEVMAEASSHSGSG